jgi:hypothetical protein
VTVVDTNGCTASDTLDVRVDALPAPVASPDIRICSGDSAQITAFGVSTVRWEPAEGLDCPDCPTTVARPARTTTYVATATGPGGCRASDSVTVVVTPSIAATLAVEDGGTVYPGRKRSVPVYLLGDLEEAGADEAIVRVDYGSAMLRLESIRPVGPFTGWALERLEEIPGRFTARLSAPPATTLRGTGEALALEFQTFLGDSTVSRISAAMTLLRRPCVTLTSRPGSLRLDSLCGMNGRLIEALDGTLSLAQNTPNPFNPSTMLVFTVPVDGPVRLDVLDAEGAVVEHLVDADLAAGTHEIVWDATGFSSGLYFARLSAGSGSQSIQMLLLK